MILADNAGFDSSDLTSQLRAAHFDGKKEAGLGSSFINIKSWPPILFVTLDMNNGVIASMRDLGITESYKLKRQVVLSASEGAEMILR